MPQHMMHDARVCVAKHHTTASSPGTPQVNVFFLKYALWIPPTNPLNTYRLLLWFLCALPGIREYYEFIEAVCPQGNAAAAAAEQRRFTKLGVFAWLAIAVRLQWQLTKCPHLVSFRIGTKLCCILGWPVDSVSCHLHTHGQAIKAGN